jgi:hypothetical protein
MKRQLTAFVAATAIALSGMGAAAPVQADDKDVLKLILGAAAVGLLLNQMNKNRQRTPVVTSGPRTDWTPDTRPTTYRGSVPGECVMDVTVNNRLREVVSQRCLREFGMDSRVPAECAFDIRTSVGTRTVYGPECLRDYGYRIEQARY